MKKYITASFQKFRQDAMAKGVYDIMKWLFFAILAMNGKYFLSENGDSVFEKVLFQNITFSLVELVMYGLTLTLMIILIVHFITNRKLEQIHSDIYIDGQTGLKNEKALKRDVPNILNRFKSDPDELTFILIDIDDFKSFNTSIGYAKADTIITKVGQILSGDKRITDETYRLNTKGDEFLIITQKTSLNGAKAAAERKRKTIAQNLFTVEGTNHQLIVSCGVTLFEKTNDTYETIIKRLSDAVTEAKKTEGKNCTKTMS